jgi:hypothetical protein
MSKATVTFEDDGDQVKVSIDFGEGGGNELSPAHNMAVTALHVATQVAGQPGAEQPGEIG